MGPHLPEPRSSAAGRRSLDLLKALERSGAKLTLLSPKPAGDRTGPLPSSWEVLETDLNRTRFQEQLEGIDPDLVVFDRFPTEEQFSWRAREACPQARTLLDTQDLHSLRRQRRRAAQGGVACLASEGPLEGPDFLRELASCLRVDGVLLISPREREILLERAPYLAPKVHVLPLLSDGAHPLFERPFAKRQGAAFLGNLLHAPNRDALVWLLEEIWPQVLQKVPEARLRVAGAYAPPSLLPRLQRARSVDWLGAVEDSGAFLAAARVQIAPLRFGAGQKGKLLEGFEVGLPAVTTPIGCEGMGDGAWPGQIQATASGLAQGVAELLLDPGAWERARGEIPARLSAHQRGPEEAKLAAFLSRLGRTSSPAQVLKDLLWSQKLRASEFMGRWIELKETRPQVLSVVAGVLEHEGRILLARRLPEKSQGGLWEFPGGKIEPEETAEAALKRELQEEFQIQTEVGAFLSTSHHRSGDLWIELQGYQARWTGGNFELKDHDQIEWVLAEDLLKYDLAPADIPLAAWIQAGRGMFEKTLEEGDPDSGPRPSNL